MPLISSLFGRANSERESNQQRRHKRATYFNTLNLQYRYAFNSKKITPVISILEIKSVKYLALLCPRCWFDSPSLFARSKSEGIALKQQRYNDRSVKFQRTKICN